MTTIPQFFLGVILTIIFFLSFITVVSFFKHFKSEIKIIFKTLLFIIKHVRIVPCFAKGVYSHTLYKNSIANKDKKYVILLKIRVHYTLKYVVYNCQTQKLYMI